MDISGITTTTNQASSTTSTTGSTTSLGKDDFLKLLTAQLQAQDPLNPMDATQFTAQLAQFSSLEQLTNINTQLTDMAAAQTSQQNMMATDLIGKTVGVTGNTVTLNGQATLNYSLASNSATTTVSIYDANGTLVKQQVLSGQSAGEQSFAWDGKDTNGSALPNGQYTFAVSAVDSSGNAVGATTQTYGTVTGVSFQNNTTYLTLDGNTQVQLGDVYEIIGGA